MGNSIGTIFGVIACFLCIGLLMSLAMLETNGGLTKLEARSSNDKVKLDPLYAFKRRVPNGADPIHNRRAGKSGRPPGKA